VAPSDGFPPFSGFDRRKCEIAGTDPNGVTHDPTSPAGSGPSFYADISLKTAPFGTDPIYDPIYIEMPEADQHKSETVS
jgi:hypothetical protein